MNEALRLQREGLHEYARKEFLRACELESTSADLVDAKPENEPSRGMLYLGAASLAKMAGELDWAERLVGKGMSGFPTPRVKEDLHKLYAEINFARKAKNIASSLNNNETLFSFMSGDAIGYGLISAKALSRRLESLNSLVTRTIQRLSGLPFKKSANKKQDEGLLQLNVEWAPPGSFGLKLSLSHPVNQSLQLLEVPPEEIIKEVMDDLHLVGLGEECKVREKIRDEEYSENFIANAKDILPDGEKIKEIGIVSKGMTFVLDKTKREVNESVADSVNQDDESDNDMQTLFIVTGYLRISNGIGNFFKIVPDDNKKPIKIYVPDALDELARKYFGDKVEIRCEKKRKSLYLIDITPLDT
ncbi:MAG: hypothetical protein HDQ93_05285 [Desulfovibrio sp.]|nr:hypothetical protein [Desulfovibrio sp.]